MRHLTHPFRYRRWQRALSNLTGVFIDLETGGVDPVYPEAHAILKVGLLSVYHGLPIDMIEFGVVPYAGLAITKGAVAINGWSGIQPDDVTEERMLGIVSGFFDRHPSRRDHIPVCGHNVMMDFEWLCASARRNNVTWPPERMSRRYIDSCVMSTSLLLTGVIRSRSLGVMADSFGIDRGDAHVSPLDDCKTSFECVKEILWRQV